LRRSIERQEMVVYYQPIHCLTTGDVLGFEALARWNHPEFGIVSPAKFIPLAEEIGLIDTLGEHILRLSCTQIRRLKDRLNDDSRFLLSVNLSCKQFENPDLVQKIKHILDETGFPPTHLKLEITESVFFQYEDKAVRMLHQLRDLGIEINIDDFGTGYSNLSYLMQLPISTLKIDRSFIEPIRKGSNNTQIVQTIIMLAKNLGMKVIAEGVETEYQIEQLKKFDCEVGQGYYFSRPMQFEDLEQFLGCEIKNPIPKPGFEDISVVSTIQ
jgi:EAL domain-containing protein (putative c-di-GMP-specific phosphodiesterase class I)